MSGITHDAKNGAFVARASEPHGPGSAARRGGDLDALLQPTLGGQRSAAALYSVRASFMVAFFGGVYASLLFSFLNSRRLGRTREDGWLYALIAGLWTAFLAWGGYALALDQLPDWLAPTGQHARDFRYIARACALLVFGGIYLRLRRFFRAADLAGMEAPSPWKPGLLVSAVAFGLNFAALAIGATLAGAAAR